MNRAEKEAAEEMKLRIYYEQDGCCFVCGEPLGDVWDVAHRIPKSKVNLRLYGKEIVHHRKNVRGTCRGACNDAVMINPATRPLEAAELVKEIKEELHD